MSSIAPKPVWTSIPLIDHHSFEKRVLRAFPFAAKAIEGTDRGVMQGKTKHWQAETLHFSVQCPLQKSEEDEPRARFNRLRKMEPANAHLKLTQMREAIKGRLRDLPLDYVNLLDEVDDFESFLSEDKVNSDTVPELTLLKLRELTDKNTIFSSLDHVDLSRTYLNEPLRLLLAAELNLIARPFSLTRELYDADTALKITNWIKKATELLNEPTLNEIELRGLIAAIHVYEVHVSFVNRVSQLYKELKSKIEKASPKIKLDAAKLKTYSSIQEKAFHLLHIRNNVNAIEVSLSKVSVVTFDPQALLYILNRYRRAYEGLKKLDGVDLDDLDEWFNEVQEAIENEEFDRAEKDFELMKEVFFENETVKAAVKKISYKWLVQIESMSNFRSKAFFDELKTLLSTAPLETVLQKIRTDTLAGYKLTDFECELLERQLKLSPSIGEALDQFKEILERKHKHNKTNLRLFASARLSDPLTSMNRFLNLINNV